MFVVGNRPKGRALAEATLDALAADLTVPHARPLVDLERDDYADLEVGEPQTVRFARVEIPATNDPATAPFTRPYETIELRDTEPLRETPLEPTARTRKRGWSASHVVAALVTLALGFGLGAGISLLLA